MNKYGAEFFGTFWLVLGVAAVRRHPARPVGHQCLVDLFALGPCAFTHRAPSAPVDSEDRLTAPGVTVLHSPCVGPTLVE